MAIKSILIHPDPRLKKVCDPVPEIGVELRRLAEDMIETMYDAPGVGLAAPQVGVCSRLFVMDCAPKDQPQAPVALFNPRITWVSEEMRTHEEGCLSLPEVYADITRPARVRVAWTGIDGVAREEEFDGLWATCAQHEIDHLDGRLFIDGLSYLKRTMITQKMKKLKRSRG